MSFFFFFFLCSPQTQLAGRYAVTDCQSGDRERERRKKRKRLFLFLVPLHKAATAVSSRSFPMTLWRRGTRERKRRNSWPPFTLPHIVDTFQIKDRSRNLRCPQCVWRDIGRPGLCVWIHDHKTDRTAIDFQSAFGQSWSCTHTQCKFLFFFLFFLFTVPDLHKYKW